MAQGDGEMTLVIDVTALRRLSDPAAVVEDARRWSAGVGVAAEDPDELTAFLNREAVDPDFVTGERGVIGGLATVRQRRPTDRHVFVGTTEAAKSSAEAVGWEYLDVEAAAGDAEWGFAGEDEDS